MKTARTPITDDSPLLRPITLKLPAPLDDQTLLWLSAHNETFGFEQTAEGELIVSPPTGSRGNRGEGELYWQVISWNKRAKFGEVRGLTGGILLPKGGQYDPDVFVLTQAAWDAVPLEDIDKGFLPAFPIAAFELLSPKNLAATGFTKEFTRKLEAYKLSAIPVVVLLNPQIATATIRRPGREDENTSASTLTFPELPQLELDAAAIYAACNNRSHA